jgi:cytochrome c-type biogenesis protein CcmH/NrfG
MMEETQETNFSTGGKIEKVAFVVLGLVMFLLPFFFIPNPAVFVAVSKGLLVYLGVVIALALFFISLIKEAKISLPKNLFSLSVIILPIVFLVSALVKGGGLNAYLGYSFELGTVTSIFFGALLMLLVAQVFRSKDRVRYSYLAFLASFAVVAIFEIIKVFFGGNLLSFGIFTNIVSNTIGNWSDLGVFFGASAIFSLITLEMLKLEGTKKIATYIALVVSLVMVAVVNFITAWIVLGIFALVLFLYFVSFEKVSTNYGEGNTQTSRKISWNSLAVLLIAFVFAFFGTSLGDKINTSLGIVNNEVRPSWAPTISIIKESIKDSPYVGTGPNNFASSWYIHKPVGVNDTVFWNIDFSSGMGLIPTFFATTGILGILSWLFFFVMFIWLGFKAIFYSVEDVFSRYYMTSSFLISLFFWIMTVVYVPSVVNFMLGCFFTGLFAASLYSEGILKSRDLSLTHHPKLSFVSVLVLIVMLIGSVSLGYLVVEKSISGVYFQSALMTFAKDNNIAKAEATTQKAIALAGFDIYYRGMSELGSAHVQEIINRPNVTQESVKAEFQQALSSSITNAQKAVAVDPKNYQNQLSLARVYASLVPAPLAMDGAYESAKKAYLESLKLNPHNPNIILLIARLDGTKGDLKSAREYVNKAIAEKGNFAEAHFLLAQIEVTEGNIYKAITSLETTMQLTAENPGLYFQLGLLRYSNKDFAGAKEAFGRAVTLVPDYANAKYFLGLSQYYTGQKAEGLVQFEDLAKLNPENNELKLIISNINSGKDPFTNAKPPVTARPEKRDQLPLQQTN